ncbi:glycosyltransferase family 87 protein [Paracoccus aestuariivivens]|nr:glycosyltransferase family 87 protein [Paracoccus aestuariivivens]
MVGIGRDGGNFAFDMPYLYVAGDMWEKAISPYSADVFKATMHGIIGTSDGNYAYPPNSSYLSMSLSLGDVSEARLLIGTLNILSLILMVSFVYLGAQATDSESDSSYRLQNVLLAAAVIVGNPFAAHVSWMGQTTLISGAFLLCSWFLADQRRDVLAGVLLALAGFKPQLAILVALWFLLDRRWALLASATVVTLLISAWPMVSTGIQGSWIAWLVGLREYQDTAFNVAGFKHLFGVRSALAQLGVDIPSLAPLGVLGVILLYWQRKAYENIWLVATILGLTFLFVYAHDYDIAPATVLAYPLIRASRGRPALMGLVLFLACVLFFPQRIWEALGVGQFARSRELALMLLMGVYLTLCREPGWRRGLSASA